VPVPRRFDRRPPERDQTRVNDRIRVPEVRLVGEDGKQIGVIKTSEALAYAQERDLDLVEVAPEARPPVCRVLDYSKYKYEQAQKLKAARKHQQQITIREIKFRPKIAQHDYDTKKGHVTRFLLGRDKVKITIMFRGREVAHPERGVALLEKLAAELSEVAIVEQTPLQDGRNMTMMLAPSKAILAAAEEHHAEAEAKSSKKHHGYDSEASGSDPAGSEPTDEAPDDAPIAAADDAKPAKKAADPAPAAETEAEPAETEAEADVEQAEEAVQDAGAAAASDPAPTAAR
jgi:translation initiation factor IF-3